MRKEHDQAGARPEKVQVGKACKKLRLLYNANVRLFLMRHSLKTGLSFGLTSGVITTLGLMVGLDSGTHSKLAVIGGVLTIAIADAFSDALGIHVSEESENKHSAREVWESTISTFLFKFVFALTFVIPVLMLELSTAVMASVAWGMLVLGAASFSIAREQKKNPVKVISEHLAIAMLVVIIAYFFGIWISETFG